MFGGLPIGIRREFDQQGNLTLEIDEDKQFLFPVRKLIRKLRREFSVDIHKDKVGYVIERNTNGETYYIVDIIGKERGYYGRELKISTLSGNIIADKYTSPPNK